MFRKNNLFYPLTFRYIAALFLLFVLSLVSFLILKENINSQGSSAAIINISGRQRMLSQRIALFSLRLVLAREVTQRELISREFKKTLELMEKSHNDLPYSRQAGDIDRQVRNYLNEAKSVYSLSGDNLGLDNSHLDYLLKESEGPLIRALDNAVSLYQAESEDKIKWLKTAQAFVLTATAFILIAIGWFIFRPMAVRIREETGKLREKSQSLAVANQKLETEISRRAELEQNLISSNEFNNSLLEAIPFGIDIVDEQCNLLYLNDKMESIFGKDALGQKCYLLYKDDRKQCPNCPLRQEIPSGQTQGLEVKGALNGKTFLITHTRMSYQGRKAVLEIFEDITDYRRMQERLVSSQRLMDIGRMAGVIAHEFRNQLGVIGNAAYFLKMKVANDDQKVRRHLDILEEQVAQTGIIISNILNFSRANPPKTEAVDVAKLLALSLEKIKIPPAIEVIINKDNLPWAELDPVQIGSVFVNIILNAIQAIAEKGSLIINAAGNNNYVTIVFKDTGQGIREEDQPRIFEPFFSTKARGTGLGLATAKAIIESHRGSIKVESKYGEGTAVIINLPVKAAGM